MRPLVLLLALVTFAASWVSPAADAQIPPPTYLSNLTPISASNGWGPVERDMTVGDLAAGDGKPLTIRGVVYPKGLGVHAASDIRYLTSGCQTFYARIGVDDESPLGTVIFRVYADDDLRYDSGLVSGLSDVLTVNLNVEDVTVVWLEVDPGPDTVGQETWFDHADWADAQFGGCPALPAATPTLTSTPTRTATPTATPRKQVTSTPTRTPTRTATPLVVATSTPTPIMVSGQGMPSTWPSGWRRIFQEDFSTPAAVGQFRALYGSKFSNYDDGWPTTSQSNQVRRCSSKVVSVEQGRMVFNMHSEYVAGSDPCAGGSSGNIWLTAVEQPIPAGGQMGLTAARWSIRFRVVGSAAALPGQYLVPLLWPVSENWPNDGELDWPEGGLQGTMQSYIHLQGATWGGDQVAIDSGVPFSPAWHTATTEWVAGQYVAIFLDGAEIGRVTSRVPSTPMRYVVQTETCWGPCPTAGTNVRIEYDWMTGETRP